MEYRKRIEKYNAENVSVNEIPITVPSVTPFLCIASKKSGNFGWLVVNVSHAPLSFHNAEMFDMFIMYLL